jgi:hypothetical protein
VEEDYDQLVEWNHDVLERNDPLLDAIFAYPERAIHDIIETRTRFTDPTNVTLKAVVRRGDSSGDRVVGYVQFKWMGENWIQEEDAETVRQGWR